MLKIIVVLISLMTYLKGIRLEDVTVELEEEAYEEMRNNK